MNNWIKSNPEFEFDKATPEIRKNSAWEGYFNFAYDLITFMKPKTFVELGTYMGGSFFSFCQGVKDAALSTKCYAVDTWKGDNNSGYCGEKAYWVVDQVSKSYYPEQAILLQKTFDEALADFEDDTVDVIHIDGLHTYEAVSHDYKVWLPKLAENGIVLFHNIAVKENGFGVRRFWDELKTQCPHLEFSHSGGLGVLFPKGVNNKLSEILNNKSDIENLYQNESENPKLPTLIEAPLPEGQQRKTSIIILTYNNLAYNKGVLESIRRYTTPNTYEVIMVDNASTDGTREWLKEQADIKVILNDENTGFPKGCNIGIAASQLDYDILLLNNDIEVTQNWLENLQIALYSNPKIGAVQGLDSVYFRNSLNEKGEVIDFHATDTTKIHEFATRNNVSDSNRWKYTNYITAYCILIKRDVVNEIGLLDERFSPGNFEDDDLSYRILTAGYYLLKCHDCFIHHFGSKSFRADETAYWKLIDKNSNKFIEKWGFHAWDKFYNEPKLLHELNVDSQKSLQVLHIDCRLGGTLLNFKNNYKNCELFGVETSGKYIEIIKNIMEVRRDLTEFAGTKFDLILMGEAFRTLPDTAKFLLTVKDYLKSTGELVLIIENINHHGVIQASIEGNLLNRQNLLPFTRLSHGDIENLAQNCGYLEPAIYPWSEPTNEEDELFIKKLLTLVPTITEETYRTGYFTVKLQKESEIEMCSASESKHLKLKLEQLNPQQKEDFYLVEKIHETEICYTSHLGEALINSVKNEFEKVITDVHILRTVTTHPNIARINKENRLYRFKAVRHFYDFSLIYEVIGNRIIVYLWDWYFETRDELMDQRLKSIEASFPQIMTTTKTIEYIIKHRCSLVRYGDGELSLALNHPIIFQNTSSELQKRLIEILATPSDENLLVSMVDYSSSEDNKNFFGELSEWEYYWHKHYDTLKTSLISPFYGNAIISRKTVFEENDLSDIKKLWEDRKVVFVIGDKGRFEIKEELFDNIQHYSIIEVPAVDAFNDYDKILTSCLEEDREKLFLVSCGPTATVLAFDLSKNGYQALDIGHLPNAYDQFLGHIKSPEQLPLVKQKEEQHLEKKKYELKDKRKKFILYLDVMRDDYFTRDLGILPFIMKKYYDYDIEIVLDHGENNYPSNEKYTENITIHIPTSEKERHHLISRADVLMLFSVYNHNLPVLEKFKQDNPNGKVYCKLDMNEFWLLNLVRYQWSWVHDFWTKCDLISVECRRMQYLIARYWGINVQYIPNGYYNFWGTKQIDYEKKDNIILTVGRLGSEQKNADLLLNAFVNVYTQIPDWKLILVGDATPEFSGIYEEAIRIFPDLKERIILTGKINQEQLRTYYEKAKVFCLPSRWEACANVLSESLGGGCYPIATDFNGAASLFKNGKLGTIIPVEDRLALERSLIEVCNDEGLMLETFHKVIEYANTEINWVNLCGKIDKWLKGESSMEVERDLITTNEKSKCLTAGSLIHTLLFMIREETLEEDLERARKCLISLENSYSKKVIIFNNGFWDNQRLYEYLEKFKLEITLIGGGENTGTVISRQSCFKYIWNNYPETDFISELHLDMVFPEEWELPLIKYLNQNKNEPMISCGIVDKHGEMPFIDQKISDMPEIGAPVSDDFLNSLKRNSIVLGFTMPCIHRSQVLQQVGGYNPNFLTGKQCFEDDSLLLGYHLYYGTKANWQPKVNYNSVVYHEVEGQRKTLNDNIYENFEGVIKQYGVMGLKALANLHIRPWHKGFFANEFKQRHGADDVFQQYLTEFQKELEPRSERSTQRIFYINTPGMNVPTTEILKNYDFNPIEENSDPELQPGDLIFFTYCFPFSKWHVELLQRCHFIGAKSVLIVLDLHSFYSSIYGDRFGHLTLENECHQRLFYGHYIIAQTERMKLFLKAQNIGVPIYVYELFDFLLQEDKAKDFHRNRREYFEKIEKNRIVYAGIIGNKFRNFLYDVFHHDFKLDIYDGYEWAGTSYDFPGNRYYKGNYSNDELPFQFKGNYGLIWNNPELTDTMRFKELSISSKLGLYVASELPIIVQKGTADAEFVEQNQIGFTISCLTEIDSILEKVTDKVYMEWLDNLKNFASKVRQGYFLKRAVEGILEAFRE